MAKILYAEDNPDLREVFLSLFESYTDVPIVSCVSGNSAVSLLKSDKFDLVISDYTMPDGNADVIVEYLNQNNINIPVVILSGDALMAQDAVGDKGGALNITYLDKPPEENQIKEILESIGEGSKSVDKESYVPIKTKTFFRSTSVPVDMYVQLSGEKFVKVYQKGDPLKREDITKYRDKNVENFYVKSEDLNAFSSH